MDQALQERLNSRMNALVRMHEKGKITQAERDELSSIMDQLEAYETRSAVADQYIGNGAAGATEEDRAFDRYLRTGDTHGLSELRVSSGWTTQSSDTALASVTIPQGFWDNLQVALKAYGGIANDFHEVLTDNGRVMPWPTIDPTTVVASLVATELTQLSVASPYVFGSGQLNAWTAATNPVLISLQALQDSEFDLGGFLAARLGEQVGRLMAQHAVSGTGSSQPQGVITALNAKGTAGTVGSAIAATGGFVTLATAASVKTFSAPAGATELVGNVLSPASVLAMVQAVDPAYYDGAKFYMNNNMAYNMHGVIDANGRPLLNFDEGFQNGAVGTILGFPVVVDNNLPSLAASTTGGPVFGNMNAAMVRREVRNSGVMRLDQRWADQLAVGYILAHRYDMRGNDLRSAVTVKPAAT